MKTLLGVVSLVSVLVSGGGTAAADTPFASAVFRATHNSYSGNVEGAKNSLTYQLDHGVRYLELDVHDNGYGSSGDYGVGHDSPGNQVDHAGGNPASNALRDWLRTVNTWSAAHPDHAPLVVMLDLKDDLTDNASFAAGNLTALNKELTGVFGSRLVLAEDHPSGLPSVDALRGKVLTLLSGDGKSRTEYRRDVGYHPAVALNGRGQIVEVHDSGSGALWYWTGTYGADGRVTWLRHGRFDTGKTPAVALNDNGQLVEVHQSQSGDALWYRTGKLGSDGEITWSISRKYDSGALPTVRFTDPAGTTVREIHKSQGSSQNWAWKGVFDGDGIVWSGNAKTSDARYDVTVATRGSSRVSVWTGADGASSAQTLRYSTDRVTGARIRYEQTAFVEFQEGNSAELKQGALFYAAPAGSKSFITSARQAGRVVRGWDFDSAGQATSPLANYPATNRPYEGWYQTLMTQAGAVQ
ncbi:phosphatidylinositol-specific phospholipase C domain-containing protein [Amycolatopsis sp. lyj-112]|uniref:phosphatidylinositol-specific phospholipase C domain-containing protein n=1 Tax=Amycolatopsis sp. lyj-112 TaxID=2789288 RepID=UPI00397BDAD5